MNAIEWVFKLTDKVSAPAGRMAFGMGQAVQTLQSGLDILDRMQRGVEAVGRAGAAALRPAIFKESTVGALSVMLGDTERAAQMYASAVQKAAATPFETEGVVRAYKQLLAAQFKQDQVPIVFDIVGDAASMAEEPLQAMEAVNRGLSQMKSKGRMSAEEMQQIAEAVPLSTLRVYEELGKIYGVTADEARKLQETGKITGDVGVFAILKVLDELYGGNMEQASKKIAGLWSTLTSRPFEFLQGLSDTRGYEVLRDALVNVTDTFSVSSIKGQELLAVVEGFGSGLMEKIFGPFAGEEGAANVDATMDSLIGGFEHLEAAVFGFTDGITLALSGMGGFADEQSSLEQTKATFEAVGESLGVILKVGGGVASVLAKIYGWFHDIGEWISDNPMIQSLVFGGSLFNVGAAISTGSIGEGIRQSFVGNFLGMSEAGTGYATQADFDTAASGINLSTGERTQAYYLAQSVGERGRGAGENVADGYAMGLDEGFREKLGINSPSRVMAELGEKRGRQTGEGLEQGVRRGVGEAAAPGGGGGLVVHMPITIPAGMASEDADSLASAIRREIEPALAAVLESYALQMGRLSPAGG